MELIPIRVTQKGEQKFEMKDEIYSDAYRQNVWGLPSLHVNDEEENDENKVVEEDIESKNKVQVY
jgi:hypothetical protein